MDSREPNVSETIKLRVLSDKGVTRVVSHENYLKYPPTSPVENKYPDLDTFPSTEVETLGSIDHHIFKVEVRHELYCTKSVHRTSHECNFKREIEVLQHCSHPNIICLVGVVIDAENRIGGVLLDYVENGKSLRDAESITKDECEGWTDQIRRALSYLHSKDLVWGDAKASNVLIREDATVVLIDFGGGHTKEWVERENYESTQGDWQGFENIWAFLRDKVHETSS